MATAAAKIYLEEEEAKNNKKMTGELYADEMDHCLFASQRRDIFPLKSSKSSSSAGYTLKPKDVSIYQ